MKSVDPEFIVMTEGLHDSVLDSYRCSRLRHRTFYASADDMAARPPLPHDDAFPKCSVTFPEVIAQVRVPTPMMDRGMAITRLACA